MSRRFHPDKLSVGKWLMIGLGALCGFIATLFDTKIKDKLYEKKLDQEIEKQAKKLLEEEKAA